MAKATARVKGVFKPSDHPNAADPETKKDLDALALRYTQGGIGYKESKEMLLSEILALVTPMRERREKYKNNLDAVYAILADGKTKAKAVADVKMDIIKKAIGVA